MSKSPTVSDTPQDRITRIADTMLTVFNNHAEKRGADRAIVFVTDTVKEGGIAFTGYVDNRDAIVDLIVHLRAMLRTQGLDLHFVPVGTTPPKERV